MEFRWRSLHLPFPLLRSSSSKISEVPRLTPRFIHPITCPFRDSSRPIVDAKRRRCERVKGYTLLRLFYLLGVRWDSFVWDRSIERTSLSSKAIRARLNRPLIPLVSVRSKLSLKSPANFADLPSFRFSSNYYGRRRRGSITRILLLPLVCTAWRD